MVGCGRDAHEIMTSDCTDFQLFLRMILGLETSQSAL